MSLMHSVMNSATVNDQKSTEELVALVGELKRELKRVKGIARRWKKAVCHRYICRIYIILSLFLGIKCWSITEGPRSARGRRKWWKSNSGASNQCGKWGENHGFGGGNRRSEREIGRRTRNRTRGRSADAAGPGTTDPRATGIYTFLCVSVCFDVLMWFMICV